MEEQEYIPVLQLCEHYELEITFFDKIREVGLLEVTTYSEQLCISQERLSDFERLIRIHRDLDVNLEGIDVVFNLLKKVDQLNNELTAVKNKLRLYEEN